jgi:uncharacterized protein DUF1877
MSCLGVHFSIPADHGGPLWDGDDAARAFVAELEETWDTDYLQQTDKAWDPIHRCLTDGTFGWCPEAWPLNGAILGDDPLYTRDDYIIQHLTATEVVEVADALDPLTQEWFRARFLGLPGHGYQDATDEDAFDYTWYWFERMRAFFRKTADEGRAMLFTADQ